MTTYGYIRTSREQEIGHPGSDPQVQRRQLVDAGVDPARIYSDVAVSGTKDVILLLPFFGWVSFVEREIQYAVGRVVFCLDEEAVLEIAVLTELEAHEYFQVRHCVPLH